MIVALPSIDTLKGPIAPEFTGTEHKSAGLVDALRDFSVALDRTFSTPASRVDGMHREGDHAG